MNQEGVFFNFTLMLFYFADAKYLDWSDVFFCWFWPEIQCDSMQPAQQMAWPHYLKPLKRPHVTNKANEVQERVFPSRL